MVFFRRSNIVIIVALVILGALAYHFNLVFTIVHSLIDIFAGGRSFTKVFAFLAYLIVLLLIAQFAIIVKPRFGSWTKRIILAAIIAAYLLNVGSFLWFTHHYGFRSRDFIITVNNGELSTTKLLHNHTIKGAVGSILSFTKEGQQENIDTGLAFVHLVPLWIYIATLLLVIIILAGIVYNFITGWPQINSPRLYILIYAIVSFSLVKNIFDGGLLNYEAPVSIAFFTYLLFYDHPKAKYWTVGIIAAYLVGSAVFYFTGFFSGFNDFSYHLYITGTYAAVLFGLCYLLAGKPLNRQAILCGILFAAMLYYPLSGDLSILGYRGQAITPEDGAIVGLYHPPTAQTAHSKLLERIGNLQIYDYRPAQPERVGQFFEENKLLDNLYPLTLPWHSCLPKDAMKTYEFTLSVPSPLVLPQPAAQPAVAVKATATGQSNGLYRYRITMYVPPCWPREVNIIQEYFSAIGFQTFFINDFSGAAQ